MCDFGFAKLSWLCQAIDSLFLIAVTKLIETAQPSIDFTQRKYGDAHDAVVASATYNRALEAAAEVIQRFQVHALQLSCNTLTAWHPCTQHECVMKAQ